MISVLELIQFVTYELTLDMGQILGDGNLTPLLYLKEHAIVNIYISFGLFC